MSAALAAWARVKAASGMIATCSAARQASRLAVASRPAPPALALRHRARGPTASLCAPWGHQAAAAAHRQQLVGGGAAAAGARRLATNAASPEAAALGPFDVDETDSVYEASFDPDYLNFVALTGTLTEPRRTQGGGYAFVLRVRRAQEGPGEPELYDAFDVQTRGHMAEVAAAKLLPDMLVAVQGKAQTWVDPATNAGSFRVLADQIGVIPSATPESLVAGEALQAADPNELSPPQPPQPAATAARNGGGARALSPADVPGMPEVPRDDRERLWMDVFLNTAGWYDNRETKRGKQPDFKAKAGGDALWLDSRATPQWVLSNLQLLPGNKPYVPPPPGAGYGGGAPAAAAGPRPAFVPEQPGSQREALWVDVFTNYRGWWDNRINKFNPKAPDFKRKDGNDALWLSSNDTPEWVKLNIDEGLPPPPPPRG